MTLLHPATLDSMFQLVFAGLQNANTGYDMRRAAVPTYIGRLYVSAHNHLTPNHVGSRFIGHATATRHGGEIRANITYCAKKEQQELV